VPDTDVKAGLPGERLPGDARGEIGSEDEKIPQSAMQGET